MRALFILLLLGFAQPMLAQQDGLAAYRQKTLNEFDKYQKRVDKEAADYRRRVNEDYARYMRQAWKSFEDTPADTMPKEDVIPVPPVIHDENAPEPVIEQEIPVEPVEVPVEPAPQPKPVAPVQENPEPQPGYFTTLYCGTEIRVRLSENEKFLLPVLNRNAVSDAGSALSEKAYDNLLLDCLTLREKLQLCDWAYLQMLATVSEAFLGESSNESVLLCAWLYCQSGYKMRLGIRNSQLEMLVASEHKIFGVRYYEVNGEKFYSLNDREGKMEIFDYAFECESPLSLLIGDGQRLSVEATPLRTLASKRYPDLSVQVCSNQNDLRFYETYPTSELYENVMTRWAMYANVPLSEMAQKQLYPALRNYLKGLSEQEAVNRLLNWVQTAFVYELDDKVWGGDRAFFAEETLYYPYCDCEDRSILFSRLVRDLLGLDVLLLYYPGHLATAVCLNQPVQGDYVIWAGKRYVVADPTYIGAPLGETMPDMNNSTAKAIRLPGRK